MDQFQQIGEVLGSLKALMVFRDEIRINQRQCCLLFDLFNLGFEAIAKEIKQNLRFDEKLTKWKALKQPLKELHMIFGEGEQFIKQCMETNDWWTKAISLSQNTDCVEFHIHNLLWCVPVVIEAIETVGEFSGSNPEEIHRKRIVASKKYDKEWVDSILFQHKFGKQYLVSQDLRNRLNTVWREDRWVLMDMIEEKRISGSAVLMKQEHPVAELLLKSLSRVEPSKGKLFPSSILVGSKDYQVRRRLGNGNQYKEIQWMGESFAVRHIFGEIEPLIPEISLLSSLFHSNIVQFLCSFSDEAKKECFLVIELMNKDLGNYIKEICSPRKRVPFSLPVAVDIMLQIARGMEYLHSRGIYHGDLNPSNVLVRKRNFSAEGHLHVKVSGFGLSSFKNFTSRTLSNQTSTKPCIWYAPEVLSEQEQLGNSCESKYSEKADVYSFGMICFELLTGKVPFEEGHLQGDQMGRNIRAGERPLFPFPSTKYLTSLTKRCWHSDPIQRPGFSSICRILRYIKRFLVMNPDHSQSDPPLVPLIDYYDLEMSLLKRFDKLVSTETTAVAQVPFQMFAYRVYEREKSNLTLKEKSSESGSEGASVSGDDPVVIAEETLSSTPVIEKSQGNLEKKKASAKKSIDAKANKNSARLHKGKQVRPAELMTCKRSLRTTSKSQHPIELSLRRWAASGHASDSELA